MNDLALAENVVYEMRMAALRELSLNAEVHQPTVTLEHAAPESTPNEHATIFEI